MSLLFKQFEKKYYHWALLFIGFLVLHNLSYQQKSMLSIHASANAPQEVRIQWDTGDGWNDLESLSIPVLDKDKPTNLPFVSPKRIKLTSAAAIESPILVANDKGDEISFVARAANEYEVQLPWSFSRKFHLFVFIFQCSIAAFLTYCVWVLNRFKVQILNYSRSDLGRFHLRLAILPLVVHFLWIMAYWPSAATNDSWSSLYQAHSLDFSDWQPYTYALFLLACLNLGGSVLMSAIIQMFAATALVTSTLAYAVRMGLNRKIAWAFVLFFAVSPGIGTHNTILWKDILFSYAVCTLGILFYLFDKKSSERFFPRWSWVLWFLFLVVLFSFRQNGIIFYLVLPVWAWYRLAPRIRRPFLILCGSIFLSLNFLIPAFSGIERTSGSPMHEVRSVLAIMTNPDFFSTDRKRDIEIVEEATGLKYDFLVANFPHHWFQIWDSSRTMQLQFSQTKGYTERYTKGFVLRLMIQNPGILLTFRFRDFFRTIGIETSESSEKNGFAEYPTVLHGTNLGEPGKMMYQVLVKAKLPSKFVHEIMRTYENWSREYDGLFSRSVFLWGLPLALVVLLICLLRDGWSSQLGLATLPHIASSLVIFLIGSESCWRYYYSIYVAFFILAPLLLIPKVRPSEAHHNVAL